MASLVVGTPRPDLWHPDGEPAVIVAPDLDPSAVATLRPELVTGIALAGGAPTGHAAIVARALGIPLVLGLGAALTELKIGAADVEGAVDGSDGRLFIESSPADIVELDRVASAVRSASARPAVDAVWAEASGWRANGVSVVANVASALEAEAAVRAGAEGIGLVRTELLFLGRSTPPSIGEQRATYARIHDVMGDRPVVFRALDVGGDKPAEWQSAVAEANPAPLAVRVGVMIEVPSAAIMADAMAESADFFSIGTNDLVQYVLAADRTNPVLADLASALQPAVLRLIDAVVRTGHTRGRQVAVCGEAAADPACTPFLVGLGVTELSVSPGSVAAVWAIVAGTDIDRCRALAARAIMAGSLTEVQTLIR